MTEKERALLLWLAQQRIDALPLGTQYLDEEIKGVRLLMRQIKFEASPIKVTAVSERARHEDTERSREQQDGGNLQSDTAKS